MRLGSEPPHGDMSYAEEVMLPWPKIEEVVLHVERDQVNMRLALEQLTNAEFEARWMLGDIAVRLVRRMLSRPAEEDVVMDHEYVPADWRSHLIISITGQSVPKGHGWRWRLRKHAKLRSIPVYVKHYRVCPHVSIPGSHTHVRWMLAVGDDVQQSALRGRHS